MNKNRLIFSLLSAAVVLLAAAAGALAQAGSGAVEFEPVEVNHFPKMQAVVTAVDANGIPFTGLTVGNFILAEDGQNVEATATEKINPVVPVSLLLLIDKSGSMSAKGSVAGKTKLDEAKESAVRFLQNLQPSDRAAILAFGSRRGVPINLNQGLDDDCKSEEISKERSFTDDKGALINCVNSLDTIANVVTTPLYDAAYKAVVEAKKEAEGQGNRPVVILFTDGKDDDSTGNPASANTRQTAELAAKQENIAIFTIGVGADADAANLQALAQNTGGAFTQAPDAAGLDAIYTDIANRLRTQYDLTWQSKVEADGKPHQLGVKVAVSGKELAGLTPFVPICTELPGIRFFFEQPSPVFAFTRETERKPLDPGQEFKTNWKLTPDITACNLIDRVEYYFDDEPEPAAIAQAAPFTLIWPADHPVDEPTSYTIRAVAYDTQGNQGEASIPLMITKGGGIVEWIPLLIGLVLLVAVVVLIFALRRQRQPEPISGPGGGALPYPEPFPPIGRTTVGDSSTPPPPTPPSIPISPGLGSQPPLAPPRPNPIAWFVVTAGPEKGREFQVLRTEMRMGRGGDSEIHLEDGTVSREHATLRWENGQYYLYDLGSVNTAKVNGRGITKMRLQDNDQITLGNTTLVFKMTGPNR
ncbi:MAG: VWA domain-containing protein [Caldilineales bacterium]|nr:VWA domain-containing protein [Caldilineales bacterium]MCW5858317.1 VWA domain-containing protein [Caldilineales bacterium]